MTFQPTKQQLEELGFEKVPGTSLYGWRKRAYGWYSFYIRENVIEMNGTNLFPESIDDIKTLIRILNPPS